MFFVGHAGEEPLPDPNVDGKQYTAALRRIPFLSGLDPLSLADLARSTQPVTARKGEEIFIEGDPCRGMYLVLSGRVKVYRSSLSGREQILAIEDPGTVVAELPLMDGEAYPASCAAIDDARLLLVPRPAFEDMLRQRPEIALEVIKTVGRRLRQLVLLVDELSLLEVPQRLAKYLMEERERRGTTFRLDLSNQEIANRVGTVREIISRNLHRFESLGLIEITGRTIRILDEDGLETLVDEGL
jgi:CRP/FNR family transcriptional regulator